MRLFASMISTYSLVYTCFPHCMGIKHIRPPWWISAPICPDPCSKGLHAFMMFIWLVVKKHVLTILKNMKVNGKDDIPYIMEK